MKSFFKYGTYGFMSMLLFSQLAMADKTVGEKIDRTALDAKKSARSIKRDVKKAGRSVTGKGSVWKDVKDEASDGIKNTKDEFNHAKKHKGTAE